jgi:DNA primase
LQSTRQLVQKDTAEVAKNEKKRIWKKKKAFEENPNTTDVQKVDILYRLERKKLEILCLE